MRSTLFSALLLLYSLFGYSQHSFQKLDVNTLGASGAYGFTSFQGKTYFIATDSIHGHELWWTDGQSFGMVADITPGAAGSFEPFSHSPEARFNNMAVAGNKLFFRAKDAVWGTELFEYDGVNPPLMSEPLDIDTFGRRYSLTELNGKLYFIARKGNDAGLYSYDPNLRTYTLCLSSRYLSGLVPFRGRLATVESDFMMYDSRLYLYDPGKNKIDTVAHATSWSGNDIGGAMVYKDVLYFLLNSSSNGAELYRCDVVGSQPKRIMDIGSGPAHSFPHAMTGLGNKLYFVATPSGNLGDFNLYSYNILNDQVQIEQQVRSSLAVRDMIIYGRKLFIACDSNNNQVKGLYEYDGNSLVRMPYQWQGYADKPVGLAESNGRLYFSDEESSTQAGKEAYVYVDSVALGIDNMQPKLLTTVFPNPVHNEATIVFTLKQTTMLHVQLTDMQGRTVHTLEMNQCSAGQHEIKMPVQGLAAGNYIYSILTDAGETLANGRLVKQ